MLRIYFRHDRCLLCKLCQVTASVVTESFQTLLGKPGLIPGMVICAHTYGNFLNHHLHCMVTDSGFDTNSMFHVLPKVSLAQMEQLFRHRILKTLLD